MSVQLSVNNYTISAISYGIARWSLYILLIFSPLTKASVQDWAVTTIHLVTLIALTAFFVEKSLTGNWKWIKTPLDKPILIKRIPRSSAAGSFFRSFDHTGGRKYNYPHGGRS